MKFIKVTFLGALEVNAEGNLTRPIVLEQVLPLEPIEKHGMQCNPGMPWGLGQAQVYELRIFDAPDPEIVVPQQVSGVNPPKV